MKVLLARSAAECYGLEQLGPGVVPSDPVSGREVEITWEDNAVRGYGLLHKQSSVLVSSKVHFL